MKNFGRFERLRRFGTFWKVLGRLGDLLGIFGTFLGILIGLLQFNPSDISSSVPSLLGGMRIAFITSVTGLFGYIVVNVLVKQDEVAKFVAKKLGIPEELIRSDEEMQEAAQQILHIKQLTITMAANTSAQQEWTKKQREMHQKNHYYDFHPADGPGRVVIEFEIFRS